MRWASSHKGLARVLDSKFQVVDPATFEFLEEHELVPNIDERFRVLMEAFFVRNGKSGQLCLSLEVCRNAFLDECVWDKAYQHANGDRSQAKQDCSYPLVPNLRGVFLRNAERYSTNKNNKNLSTAHSEVDSKEEVIAR